jgi:hypothetical protein
VIGHWSSGGLWVVGNLSSVIGCTFGVKAFDKISIFSNIFVIKIIQSGKLICV